MKITTISLLIGLSLHATILYGASDSVSSCITLLSPNWSEQEQWVWEKLCNRERADFNQRLGLAEDLLPWEAESSQWGEGRVLSRQFLLEILLDEPFASALSNRSITISGAWIKEDIRFQSVNLPNLLGFYFSRFDGDVNFNTSITNRIIFRNSWLKGSFGLTSVESYGLYLTNSRIEGETTIGLSTIRDDIMLAGATFAGIVNLSSTKAGGLIIGASVWKEGVELLLRGAQINRMSAIEESWDGLDGELDLNGFVYDQFSGSAYDNFAGTQEIGSVAEWSPESLLTWLEKQKGRNEVIILQPYEQLARVLYAAGQDAKADRILYEKNEYQRLHASTPFSDKTWLTIKKIVIGYGYQIWLTIIWLFGLIGFGALVMFQSSQGRPLGIARCCLYSFDQALPLIDLDPKHQDLAREQSAQLDYYFKTQQISSLILISFLGAGLAGAIG